MDLPATDRLEGMEKGVTTPAQSALQASVGRLGLTAGQVIQEFGYDSDVDDDFRRAGEDHTGTELEDEEYQDVADASLIWWRQDDGDLVDAVVDALPTWERAARSSSSR